MGCGASKPQAEAPKEKVGFKLKEKKKKGQAAREAREAEEAAAAARESDDDESEPEDPEMTDLQKEDEANSAAEGANTAAERPAKEKKPKEKKPAIKKPRRKSRRDSLPDPGDEAHAATLLSHLCAMAPEGLRVHVAKEALSQQGGKQMKKLWPKIMTKVNVFAKEEGKTVVFVCDKTAEDAKMIHYGSEEQKLEAHKKLALCLMKLADPWGDMTWRGRLNDPGSSGEGTWKFALTWLPKQLEKAKMKTELEVILNDVVWIQEKCLGGPEFVDELIQDYMRAKESFGVGTVWGSPTEEWAFLISSNRQELCENPERLFQMCINLPDGMAPAIATERLLVEPPLRKNKRVGMKTAERQWLRWWAKPQLRNTSEGNFQFPGDVAPAPGEAAVYNADGSQVFAVAGRNLYVCDTHDPSIFKVRQKIELFELPVFDIKTNELLNPDKVGMASSLAISPDETMCVTGGSNGDVKLWDLKSLDLLGSLAGHSGRINQTVFSSDSTLLGSCSDDKTCRIWDLATKSQSAVLTGHEGGVRGVAFVPNDGEGIVTVSQDTNTCYWNFKRFQADWAVVLAREEVEKKQELLDAGTEAVEKANEDKELAEKANEEAQEKLQAVMAVAGGEDADGPASPTSPKDGGKKKQLIQKEAMLARSNVKKAAEKIEEVNAQLDEYIGLKFEADEALKEAEEGVVKLDTAADGAPKMKVLLLGECDDDNAFREPTDHQKAVNCVAFQRVKGPTQDRLYMATGSDDETVKIWDIDKWVVQNTLLAHSGAVTSIDFDHVGDKLVSTSRDKKIIIWSLDIMIDEKTLMAHSEAVHSIMFRFDDKFVLSSSFDATMMMWNLAYDPEIRPPEGEARRKFDEYKEHNRARYSFCQLFVNPQFLICAFFHRNARLRHKGDKFVPITVGIEKKGFQDAHAGRVRAIVFTSTGLNVATGGGEGRVKVWDLVSACVVGNLDGHTDAISGLGWILDMVDLVSCSFDHTAVIWDVVNNNIKARITSHAGAVNALALHRDCRLFVTASSDSVVRMWDTVNVLAEANGNGDLEATKCKHYLEHEGPVNCVAFCRGADAFTFASGSDDCTIRIWDLRDGLEKLCLQGHYEPVHCLCYSPDGSLIASGMNDLSIKYWEAGTGFCKADKQRVHQARINCLTFSLDSTQLISVSDDCTINYHDATSKQIVETLTGRFGAVSVIAYGPAGKVETLAVAAGSSVYSIDHTTDNTIPNINSFMRDDFKNPDQMEPSADS